MKGQIRRSAEVEPAGHEAYLVVGVVACGEFWIGYEAVGVFVFLLNRDTNEVNSVM